jgi:hypothetical protein
MDRTRPYMVWKSLPRGKLMKEAGNVS